MFPQFQFKVWNKDSIERVDKWLSVDEQDQYQVLSFPMFTSHLPTTTYHILYITKLQIT